MPACAEPPTTGCRRQPSTTRRSACRPTIRGGQGEIGANLATAGTPSRSTSGTRPTSPGHTCLTRRAWQRRSPATSRQSASPSTPTPPAGGRATSPTKRVGKYEMCLLGWTCDWPGPDNFLVTAFFYFQGADPNPEFAYEYAALKTHSTRASRQHRRADAQAAWEEAQDILATDLPTIPLIHSTPPAAASADIKGFLGAGDLNELLLSGLARPLVTCLAVHRGGPSRDATVPRGLRAPGGFAPYGRGHGPPVLKYIVRRLLAAIPVLFGLSIVVFAFVHLLPGRSRSRRSSASTGPRRLCAGLRARPGPEQSPLRPVPRLPGPPAAGRLRGVDHQQQAVLRGAQAPLPGTSS